MDSKQPPEQMEPLDQLLARAAAKGGVAGRDADSTAASVSESAEDAWRSIVERYSPRVFGLLVRQCGDRELAEEITQATFFKVVQNLEKYNEQGRFEPWLFRIAMNRLRDEMRRRKRQAKTIDMSPGAGADSGTPGGKGGSQWAAVQHKVVDHHAVENRDDEDPAEKISRAEQVERLRAAIASMSEADRQIIHLRHTAGMSFAEIAESLEQPLGTVLARGHRALAKLKKLMLEDEPTV